MLVVMPISRKLSSLVAVVLLAGLTLSACGNKDTDDAGTKKESSSSSSDKALTADEFFTTVVESQQKARTSHMVMKVGVGGQSVTAEGDVQLGKSFSDTAMSMSMDMGSAGAGTMKMVLVDGIFYMNLGQVTKGKYAKLDLSDKNNAFSQQFGPLLDQMDPSKQLEQFQKAVTSFERKGEPKQIDGVEAQPYEVVLDTSKVDALSELPGGAGANIPKTITYVMYLGSDNLLRRMTFEIAGSKSQIDYSKWGEDVDIKAPAASEVSSEDLSKLMSGATSS
jgi:hypothetical protein